MKKSILLALVAALALAVGFSPTASAAVDRGAQASAEKGAKCAKGKGSANASAKGKGCKWPPSDGAYGDHQKGIYLLLSEDASRAEMTLPSVLGGTCLPLPMQTGDVRTAVRKSSLSASGTVTVGSAGVTWSATWSITVKADLSYVARVDSKTEGPEERPCSKKKTFKGKLVKGVKGS